MVFVHSMAEPLHSEPVTILRFPHYLMSVFSCAVLKLCRTADPYSRLRVPKYQKVFEAIFFALFLVLYYAVLVERNPRTITPTEVLLYIWIAAFAYEEFGEFRDAGALFYSADFWTVWDLGIIGVGAAFLIASMWTASASETIRRSFF